MHEVISTRPGRTGQRQSESTGLARLSWPGQQLCYRRAAWPYTITVRSTVKDITPIPTPKSLNHCHVLDTIMKQKSRRTSQTPGKTAKLTIMKQKSRRTSQTPGKTAKMTIMKQKTRRTSQTLAKQQKTVEKRLSAKICQKRMFFRITSLYRMTPVLAQPKHQQNSKNLNYEAKVKKNFANTR